MNDLPLSQPAPVLCIGVGNPLRADDAIGLLVAQAILNRQPAAVHVVESNGDGTELLSTWAAYHAVIIIDAVASGGLPGQIYRFDAGSLPLPMRPYTASSHGFGVAEAIEMGRAINQLPRVLIVYGIEGGSFELGKPLTPAVVAAVPIVAERIMADIHAMQQAAPIT